MIEKESKLPDQVPYHYHHCTKCGEEVLDMKQLHEVAEKYRRMKKYTAKLSKWGQSIGLRIPKDLLKEYKLKQNQEVILLPEKKAIKIITE